MPARTLKLGAVLIGVGGPGQHHTWLSPEIPGDASVDVRWYIARAQQAEAAKFDHVFIVDSQFITADSPHRAGLGGTRVERSAVSFSRTRNGRVLV